MPNRCWTGLAPGLADSASTSRRHQHIGPTPHMNESLSPVLPTLSPVHSPPALHCLFLMDPSESTAFLVPACVFCTLSHPLPFASPPQPRLCLQHTNRATQGLRRTSVALGRLRQCRACKGAALAGGCAGCVEWNSCWTQWEPSSITRPVHCTHAGMRCAQGCGAGCRDAMRAGRRRGGRAATAGKSSSLSPMRHPPPVPLAL